MPTPHPGRGDRGSLVIRLLLLFLPSARRKEVQTLSLGSEEGDEGAGRSLGAGRRSSTSRHRGRSRRRGGGKQIRPRLAQTPSVGSTRGRRKGGYCLPRSSLTNERTARDQVSPQRQGEKERREIPPLCLLCLGSFLRLILTTYCIC